MEDDDRKPTRTAVVIGEDLSTFSLADIDERAELLRTEIERLLQEKERKAGSLAAAENFFKKTT